jgi:hypothetical protein
MASELIVLLAVGTDRAGLTRGVRLQRLSGRLFAPGGIDANRNVVNLTTSL